MTFISHKKRIIFVGIPRTGTTSIHQNLLYTNDIENNFTQDSNKSRHLKISDISRLDLKYALSEYTTFSVLRNPWCRYASFAQWVLAVLDNKGLKDTIEYEFCLKLTEKHGRKPDIIIRYAMAGGQSQSDFITINDEIVVSTLLKFENLKKEYSNFCMFNNIENENLRKINVSESYNYRDFYSKQLIDMIAVREKKIIDLMGYTYD